MAVSFGFREGHPTAATFTRSLYEQPPIRLAQRRSPLGLNLDEAGFGPRRYLAGELSDHSCCRSIRHAPRHIKRWRSASRTHETASDHRMIHHKRSAQEWPRTWQNDAAALPEALPDGRRGAGEVS
jgi:hypothetical protein